jgi:hypothetical protein
MSSLDDLAPAVPASTLFVAFRLEGLDPAPFEGLFDATDAELARQGIRRLVADEAPGYPCRVALEDARVGDELLLLPFLHQPANSPYRASGPIFVRRGSRRTMRPAGELPAYVTSRLMSVRAYDAADLIVDAEVCEGRDLRAQIARMFGRDDVAYLHLHNARRGCYACRVARA